MVAKQSSVNAAYSPLNRYGIISPTSVLVLLRSLVSQKSRRFPLLFQLPAYSRNANKNAAQGGILGGWGKLFAIVSFVAFLVLFFSSGSSSSKTTKSSSSTRQHRSDDAFISGQAKRAPTVPVDPNVDPHTTSIDTAMVDEELVEQVRSQAIHDLQQTENSELQLVEQKLDTETKSLGNSIRLGLGSLFGKALSPDEMEKVAADVEGKLRADNHSSLRGQATTIANREIDSIASVTTEDEREGLAYDDIRNDVYEYEQGAADSMRTDIDGAAQQLHDSMRQRAADMEKEILEERLSAKLGKKVKLVIVDNDIQGAQVDGLLWGLDNLVPGNNNNNNNNNNRPPPVSYYNPPPLSAQQQQQQSSSSYYGGASTTSRYGPTNPAYGQPGPTYGQPSPYGGYGGQTYGGGGGPTTPYGQPQGPLPAAYGPPQETTTSTYGQRPLSSDYSYNNNAPPVTTLSPPVESLSAPVLEETPLQALPPPPVVPATTTATATATTPRSSGFGSLFGWGNSSKEDTTTTTATTTTTSSSTATATVPVAPVAATEEEEEEPSTDDTTETGYESINDSSASSSSSVVAEPSDTVVDVVHLEYVSEEEADQDGGDW
jgi:hypothetical protein